MKGTIVSAIVIGFVASSASAMPLVQRSAMTHATDVVNVRIICEQDGRCYQRGRRPIVRWIYGEGSFSPAYYGPGYYGNPGSHWNWWPFW